MRQLKLNEQLITCPVCSGQAIYSPVDGVVECVEKTDGPNGHKLIFRMNPAEPIMNLKHKTRTWLAPYKVSA